MDQVVTGVLVLILVAGTISTVRTFGRMSRSRKGWFGGSSSFTGNYMGDSAGGSSDCGSTGGDSGSSGTC